jgi:predicted metalloprotease
MKRHASAASMCLLWITAGALYGQSAPPVQIGGQFQDLVERIRLSINAVEQKDLDRVEKNVEWARQYLGKTWKATMLARGQEYKQPLVIDGGRPLFVNITWSCDNRTVFQLDNAAYCAQDNVISYDGFFLAGLVKKIGEQNHSPGDFAAIVAIAHEHGHALQHQLGITAPFTFPNEQSADCFAGATVRQMQFDHVLNPRDIDEAKATLTLLADPDRAGPMSSLNGHGDWLQRVAAFNLGYGDGPEGCAPGLKSPGRPK